MITLIPYLMNLSGIFLFSCSLYGLRTKYLAGLQFSRPRIITYRLLSILLNLGALGLYSFYWGNPGTVIWLNINLINCFLITLLISAFPASYKRLNLFIQ